jgi:hypothetical protein
VSIDEPTGTIIQASEDNPSESTKPSCSNLAQPPSDEEVYSVEPPKPLNYIATMKGHLSILKSSWSMRICPNLGASDYTPLFEAVQVTINRL